MRRKEMETHVVWSQVVAAQKVLSPLRGKGVRVVERAPFLALGANLALLNGGTGDEGGD